MDVLVPEALGVSGLEFGVGKQRILQGVDFSIGRGETVGIIGPNGSGKTTLFNCISGFLTPTSGTISFVGDDILPFPPFQRARMGIGRVFQNFGIFREMSVLENMLTALEAKEGLLSSLNPFGRQRRENLSVAAGLIEEIGLDTAKEKTAESLSGGQLRLLEIGRVLALGSTLLLLDEPTAGVSPRMKDEVGTLLRRLRSGGKTVLIIEHDINFIQRFCDRIIVLNEGSVFLDGDTKTVRADRRLEELYFGTGPK